MGTSGNPTKAAAAKKAAARKPVTFDHLQGKKPITRKVYVHLDSEVSDAFDEVEGRYDALVEDHRERRIRQASMRAFETEGLEAFLEQEMVVMQAEYDAASQALADVTAVVRMESPGRKRYEALIEAHPPTEEQSEKHKTEHNVDAPYNAETFGPALVALCAVEPEMTYEQAQSLMDDWNLNEAMLLFIGAMEVCSASQVSNLGKGFGRTLGSTKN